MLDKGFRFPNTVGNFFVCHHVQTSSGARTAFFSVGSAISSFGVKTLQLETSHSPPSCVGPKEQRWPPRPHVPS